jgi:hypothetical protein
MSVSVPAYPEELRGLAVVVRQTLAYLGASAMPTTDLGAALMDMTTSGMKAAARRDPKFAARAKSLFAKLMRVAPDMPDCAVRGAQCEGPFGLRRPWLWSAPVALPVPATVAEWARRWSIVAPPEAWSDLERAINAAVPKQGG